MGVELETFDVAASCEEISGSWDDRSVNSDNISLNSNASSTARHKQIERRQNRHRRAGRSTLSPASINYHGINISQAAGEGNLPVCVLLWGMATAKRVNLMDPDIQGNTPMHFAALADNPEVLGFLQQQGRSRVSQLEDKLVDSRNEAGETPFLRAASTGKISTMKFLLDEGSDPFARDQIGNTVFIILARHSHIWGLHYMYTILCEKFGVVCIHELLCATDFNSNNALDWAADTGDVNTMEYLIRKRLDPTRIDGEGRSALHIAVKSGKLDAVRFLVKCGCDPYQLDTEKISPIAIAVDMQNRELVAIMKKEQRIKKLRERRKICCISFNARNIDPTSAQSSSGSGGVAEVSGGRESEAEGTLKMEAGDMQSLRLGALLGSLSPTSQHDGQGGMGSTMPSKVLSNDVTLYTGSIDGNCRPHALCRLKPSRFSYALIYALIVVGLWILTVCIPFYAWLVLITLLFLLLSTALKVANASEAEAVMNGRRCSRNYYQEMILAPEKYVGFYMGLLITCVLFWLLTLRVGILAAFESIYDPDVNGSLYLSSMLDTLSPPLGDAFLNIGGLSGSTDDFGLFIAVIVSLVIGAALWSQLVWISTDPGGVYTREHDFDMIMDQCFSTLGAASSQLYCRTTLVKKPLRSKYCVQTGIVIARMDHCCVWLNNSVGHGNHRTFIIFLIFNLTATSLYTVMLIRALNREVNYNNAHACMAVGKLLGREYFFSLSLCAFLSVVSLCLAALLIEQSINISKNITTNERLNRSRYPWMNDSQGKPFNHFDRGMIINTLEFWRFFGFGKDYYQEFNLLSLQRKSDKVSERFMDAEGNDGRKRRSVNGDQISGINPSPGSDSRIFHQPLPLIASPRDIAMASPFPTSRKPSVHSRQFSSNSEPPPFPNIEEPLDQKRQERERRDSHDSLVSGRIGRHGSQDKYADEIQAQNSIHLRQLEAQAQFEVRVQQAIDISNRQPYLNHVFSGSPSEVDHFQGNGSADWNGISRSKAYRSKIHTDLEHNMSHTSSIESDHSTFSAAEIKPSNHDKIPPPQFSGRLSLGSSGKSESNSGKYSLEGNRPIETINDINRDGRRSYSQSLQSYQEQDRPYTGFSGQPSSPNRPRIPTQHHFDERNHRSTNSKAIDEEAMSFVTERTSSDDRSEVEGSFVGNNPNITNQR